jgi:hypothetical protein
MAVLLDTNVLLWMELGDARLHKDSVQIIDAAVKAGEVFISPSAIGKRNSRSIAAASRLRFQLSNGARTTWLQATWNALSPGSIPASWLNCPTSTLIPQLA